jgi:hypothetical protein
MSCQLFRVSNVREMMYMNDDFRTALEWVVVPVVEINGMAAHYRKQIFVERAFDQ